MNLSARSAIKKTLIYAAYRNIRNRRTVRGWEARGRPVPPPQFVKQQTVNKYAARFGLSTLIETGTYLGDMVAACKNNFERILSIELNGTLCKAATRRFHRFRHITIIEGDSADVLPRILDGIDYPCLFWLDGHYSGGITGKGNVETPIRQELECILDHRAAGHVILIDDARCFTGDNDYPTIKDLQQMITGRDLDMAFEVKDDVIRIHPRTVAGQSRQRH